jgi:NADP-dependent 3-hydroxy acid dehydrogenase YdfG
MKIALITGATSGIGEGCARRFARGGYDLIITGRNTGKLEILKKELEAEGVQVLALAFDVRNREAARKAGDAAYAGGNVYCATKAAVKAITDGLRIDVAHTKVRVTNVKPGLVETNFSNVRFHGDNQRAASVYQGIEPLNGDDIADVAFYAASAPEHVQIAEVLVLATHQANGTVIHRD